ncbi:amidohydrolase [Mammaliicoccus sciuri]|uniref:amidohydrolase n=1 Tax=Mammaliicoccus sciuri TaxID=1296 RepID=UPI001FB27D03|nr:amidohydrolase [Mammaliicoccus sciuri]MCJ1779886.1 amidohydrolase [Mammaliicoccus sciuri]
MLRSLLFKKLEQKEQDMIKHYQYLHQYPEPSFNEVKTSQYIEAFYENKDVVIHRRIGGNYGLIVEIEGSLPGRTIALRADFDALNITEDTGLPFSSKNKGWMHACGHDAHTAYLLILAECLIELKAHLPGKIMIIHQHAEELAPGGAIDMMQSGYLNGVDEIYGIHLFPDYTPDVISYRKGPTMGGRSLFHLKVKGKGGHGSSPHLANDAIMAASTFVTNVQTVVSRRLNPFDMGVVTISSFNGLGSLNVIQDSVELAGDVRYMESRIGHQIHDEIEQLIKGLEDTFNIQCEFRYELDCIPLVNHYKQTDYLIDILATSQGDYFESLKEHEQLTSSEDFAIYLEKIPGTFFFVGCKPYGIEKAHFNHSPKFVVNEDALLTASKALGEVVLNRLSIE